jgi:hypothetical protein
VSQGFVSIDE